MVMRLSLKREVWGSNLRLVKLGTVSLMVRHCFDISSKEAGLLWRNDAEMGPTNSLFLKIMNVILKFYTLATTLITCRSDIVVVKQ